MIMEDSIAVVADTSTATVTFGGGGGNKDFLKIKEEPKSLDDLILIKEEEDPEEEDPEGTVAKPLEGLRDGGPPPFLKKIFEMVEDPRTDSIISWSESSKSFILWDTHKFSTHLLPQRFKHNNFSSFIRQLNTYKFKKINPDRWEFANELFQKGKRHLLKDIKRRTNQARLQHHLCETELNKLRLDRIQMRQEILKMKKQQENTKKHMFSVEKRIQRTEQKQQHLVDFISKVFKFKHTGFVQFLHNSSIEKSQTWMIDHDKSLKDANYSPEWKEKLPDDDLMFGIKAQLDTLMEELGDLMPNPTV